MNKKGELKMIIGNELGKSNGLPIDLGTIIREA